MDALFLKLSAKTMEELGQIRQTLSFTRLIEHPQRLLRFRVLDFALKTMVPMLAIKASIRNGDLDSVVKPRILRDCEPAHWQIKTKTCLAIATFQRSCLGSQDDILCAKDALALM